jgi:hypothetical protein
MSFNYNIDDVGAKFVVIKGPGYENIRVTNMLTELADNTKLPPL